MEFKVIALVVALIGSASCYSGGAPEKECVTMTPRHHVDPQKSAFPYKINISKRAIRAGETVEVTISGKSADDVIKGFIAQARVGDTPVGTWDASPSASLAQLQNCGNSKSNSVTHKKIEKPVSSIKLLWTAPKNLSEKVIFHVTVAKNGGVFWVDQVSSPLTVNA